MRAKLAKCCATAATRPDTRILPTGVGVQEQMEEDHAVHALRALKRCLIRFCTSPKRTKRPAAAAARGAARGVAAAARGAARGVAAARGAGDFDPPTGPLD